MIMSQSKCAYVTREEFGLMDGRKFRHVIPWVIAPELEDFEKLLSHCYDLMTEDEFEITPRKKSKTSKRSKLR
jgi:hypothetical protein